jgi:hypothetical protein
MNLLEFLRKKTALWSDLFAQTRSLERALARGFGILC